MKKSISTNKIYIYLHVVFLLILTYAYQDFRSSTNIGLREADRGTVHIILFALIALLTIFFVYTLFSQGIKKDAVKGSLWLITGWVFIVGIIQGVSIWAMLVHLGLSLLWILIYHFGRNYTSKYHTVKITTVKWIVVFFFFYVFSALYAQYNIRIIYGRTPVINLVYYVMVFYPWVTLIPTKRYRQLLNFLILGIVLLSFKRGAIIIFPLMLITYSLVKAKIENRKIAGVGKAILLSVIFICGLLIVDNFTGGFILNRFTIEALESGSGRTDLYRLAINNIKKRSLSDLMIGLGSGSSVQLLGTGVHNEWIEFMFSFGIIGLILYAKLFVSLVLRGRRYIKEKSKYAPAYASIIMYMLVIGLFGGLYFVHSTLYVMLFLGTVEGLRINEKINKEMRADEKNWNDNIS